MTGRALKYTSTCTIREDHPPVVSAVFSPDAQYLAMCHDSTSGHAFDISLWKLEGTGATIFFTMKLPFTVKSVVWPADGIGATFLGTSGSMLVLLPSDADTVGQVRVAIVKFSFDVLALCFLKKFDRYLLATASKTQISRYAVESAGTVYKYEQRFQHPAGDLEPVALAWAGTPERGVDCLWVAYTDGSVLKCKTDDGTVTQIISVGSRSTVTWASFSDSYLAAIDITQRLTRIELTASTGRAVTVAEKAKFAVFAHGGATLVYGAENAMWAWFMLWPKMADANPTPAKKGVRVVAENDSVTPWLLCTISTDKKREEMTIWKALDDKHGHLHVISGYMLDKLFLARATSAAALILALLWWRIGA